MKPVEPLPVLDADRLRAVTAEPGDCPDCQPQRYAGWESVSAAVERPRFEPIGTLRDPAVDDPTVDEHHPNGTYFWDPLAPVATRFFPYNRCDVWRCARCHCAFVQYVEAGGYYVDHRLRAIHPKLIV